jgi:hypothetical protein
MLPIGMSESNGMGDFLRVFTGQTHASSPMINRLDCKCYGTMVIQYPNYKLRKGSSMLTSRCVEPFETSRVRTTL